MDALNNVQKLTDEELVREIVQTRNNVLFAELYDRFAPRVYNRCLGFAKSKVEAEDLTHDIFIKLFVKLDSFKGNSKFSTWLYSFTYNFCVNYVQRNAYKNKEQVKEVVIKEDAAIEVSDDDLLKIKADKLRLVLASLDPKDKMILLMKYQDELSIKEISELLGIGLSAVKMRIKRAKDHAMEVYKKL